MANLYVASTGSNTAPYETWAKAATTLATAVSAAAANDYIYCHQETETISVDTTYAPAAGVKLICSNDTVNAPPTTLGARTIDGSGTSGVDITINGGYWYGFTFKSGGSTGLASIALSQVDGNHTELESCTLTISNNNTSSNITIGSNSINNLTITRNCTFNWGATSQGFTTRTQYESYGDDFVGGATVPSALFKVWGTAGSKIRIEGADLSDITSTLFNANATTHMIAEVYASKLNATPPTIYSASGAGQGDVYLYDCSYMNGSTLTGILFAHYNYLGNTVVNTTTTYTGGATHDGTNLVSWLVTSANGTFGAPYRSPWIDVYHSGTSAITPYLEILRSGSSTAYNDDEVWAEWEYKGTADSARASLASDRRGLLSTAAAQANGTDSWPAGTKKSMKIDTGSSITPAEIGYLRARVCTTGTVAVYVDPLIRGLS